MAAMMGELNSSSSPSDQNPGQTLRPGDHNSSNLSETIEQEIQDDVPSNLYANVYEPAPSLASSRYSRQVLVPAISLDGQSRIASARILIIGLGGLGSPAAMYLAGAGVGVLGLLDDDVVEESNLHRQIAHREDSVRKGMGKGESAARGCRELNGTIDIREHRMRLGTDGEEVLKVLAGYDIVLDCTDNPATRYLVSDACVLLGKTLVSGAAQRLEGQLMVLNYICSPSMGSGHDGMEERGPCYRCVFPRPPAPEMVRSCGEIGILGPVVGTIGCLMASEALRVIVKGAQEDRKPSMLLYNAWPSDPKAMFRTVGLRGKRRDCIACGDREVLEEKGLLKIEEKDIREGRLDYVTFCGTLEDLKVLPDTDRITASDFLARLNNQAQSRGRHFKVVDVREEHEIVLGPKIKDSINIPLAKVLRDSSQRLANGVPGELGHHQFEEILQNGEVDSVLFICQRGNDSQTAALTAKQYLKERGVQENVFIGDVSGGFLAIDRAAKWPTRYLNS